MASPLIGGLFRQFTAAGAPLAGGKLYSYIAGTSTPLPTYPTNNDANAGTNPNANPTVLDSSGSANIWLPASVAYKLVLKDSNDVTQWTEDNYALAGASTITTSDWTLIGGVGTTYPLFFQSSSVFAVGSNVDLTATFPPGRRVRSQNTSGLIYSTVLGSSYAAAGGGGNTTYVTMVNDSTAIDSGISLVYVGILSPVNPSIPVGTEVSVHASGTFNPTTATDYIVGIAAMNGSVAFDKLSEFATSTGLLTVLSSGIYLMSLTLMYTTTGVTFTTPPTITPYKGSTAGTGATGGAALASGVGTVNQTFAQFCNAGDTLKFQFRVGFSAGTVTVNDYDLSFIKVGYR